MEQKPPGSSDKQELLSAFDQVVTREQEKEGDAASPPPVPPRSARGWVVVTGAMAYLFLAYIWVGKPGWLFAPDIPPASVNAEEALRLELYLHASALNDHLADNGRLPATLEEVSTPEASIHYQRLGDSTWVLSGTEGAVVLTLRSADPLEQFLGTTLLDLRAPGAR